MKTLNRNLVEDMVALAPMQQMMLLDQLKDPTSRRYFEQVSLTLEGKVEWERFQNAWNQVAQRHEMLRSLFRWQGLSQPVQVVLKSQPVSLQFHDFSQQSPEKAESSLAGLKQADIGRGFDLEEVPFRILLCKMNKDRHCLIISNHHILYDGWSNGVLLKDFFRAYAAEGPLPVAKSRYKEFIKHLQHSDREKARLFWQKRLSGFAHRGFPVIGQAVPATAEGKMDNHSLYLSDEVHAQTAQFSKEYKFTFASLIYAAWGILLQRYKHSNDIAFGTPVSGRNAPVSGIEEMVGLFINTLPVRITTSSDQSILDLLQEIDQRARERAGFETVSLVGIKDMLHSKGELFDSLLIVENYPLDPQLSKGKDLRIKAFETYDKAIYPLTAEISVFDRIKLTLSYQCQAFKREQIEALAVHFSRVLQQILADPQQKVSAISLVGPEEEERLLHEFNRPAGAPVSASIAHLFRKQAAASPQSTALVFQEQSLTYQELDRSTDGLADALLKAGCGRESLVPLLLEPSIEIVLAMLAVLKTGAAYLPIDLRWPPDRIRKILEEVQAPNLVSSQAIADRHQDLLAFSRVFLPADYRDAGLDTPDLNPHIQADDLAYVLFTSGTTGHPKGIMVNQGSAANQAWEAGKRVHINPRTRFLVVTDYTLDPTITDIFGSLVHGATVVIAERNLIFDRDGFHRLVARESINMTDMVPSVIEALLKEAPQPPTLQTLLTGGEKLETELKDCLLEKGYELYNHYGLTETTVDALVKKCDYQDNSIGSPVANSQCYILDQDLNLVPIGVQGEICISGLNLARGYLNQPELSAAQFLPHPFIPGERLFKTGDLGAWTASGTVHYLGRKDQQLKIRGMRVEPREIEKALLRHAAVREAAVIPDKQPAPEKSLIGFYVSAKEVGPGEIRDFLKQSLPHYMIPSQLHRLDQILLSQSGSPDPAALWELAQKAKSSPKPVSLPQSKLEKAIAEIWKDLLNLEKVGMQDNFFDIGGNSLQIINLNSRIKAVLDLDLPVVALFEYPTIREISSYIRSRSEAPAEPKDVEAGPGKRRNKLSERRKRIKSENDG